MNRDAAVILAGGSGSRMRASVRDKVLEPLDGKPVIVHSFGAFLESGKVGRVVFACRDDAQRDEIAAAVKKFYPQNSLKIVFCRGGAERSDSVLNALVALGESDCDAETLVFIHDGARPLVGAENISRLSDAAKSDGAAVLAARVSDTIKKIPSDIKNLRARIFEDLERPSLWAMQTPQVFRLAQIRSAYKKVRESGAAVTDDVAAANADGIGVSIVENISPNPKITVPEDIARIEFLLSRKK